MEALDTVPSLHPPRRSPRRRRIAIGSVWLFLLVAVGIGVARWGRSPSEDREPERELSALEQRDGRWHEPGAVQPFSGWVVERFSDGTLQARARMVGGQLDGLSEGFRADGSREASEHFSGGISQGMRIRWSETGQRLSESPMVDGEVHGVFRRWDGSGRLVERIPTDRGQAHGLALAWHPDGSLKAAAWMDRGQLVRRHSWEAGEKWVDPEQAPDWERLVADP
jgi:hypothetical protein